MTKIVAITEKTRNLLYAGQQVRIIRVLENTFELRYTKHPDIVFQCSKDALMLIKEKVDSPIQSPKQEQTNERFNFDA